MGKRFRFYLVPSDIEAIASDLRERFGARVVDEQSNSYRPCEIESPIHDSDWKMLGKSILSVRCYIVPPNGELRLNFYSNLGKWVVDIESEAIEFSGCNFNGEVLGIGRFYYQTDFVKDKWIWPKRPEFVKWADSVFRHVKRKLTYSPRMMAYIGVAAAKWHSAGGKFASGVYGDRVVYESDDA